MDRFSNKIVTNLHRLTFVIELFEPLSHYDHYAKGITLTLASLLD